MSTLEKVALFHQAFKIQTEAELTGIPALPQMGALYKSVLLDANNELRFVADDAFRCSARLRELDDPSFCIFLRLQLIVEELSEVIQAIVKDDIAQVAHELADLDYVVMGTILNLGLGSVHNRVVDEIHRANMSKLDRAGQPILNEAGRVVKSKEFQPADVTNIVTGE